VKVTLPFDVVLLTGDHSTPAVLKDHSHHPVPTAIWSKHCLRDHVDHFCERSVVNGTLGKILARDLLGYALAEASRLNKFGA
jgi:2,3-bisphosphoglycerate-independent phosphoglycerate mutase